MSTEAQRKELLELAMQAIEAAALFLCQPFTVDQMERIGEMFTAETGLAVLGNRGMFESWFRNKKKAAGDSLRAALAARKVVE